MNENIKKVSWLELFYDLVFVALVAQLTYAVAEHHTTLLDLFSIVLVGYIIFLAWLGTTVNRNLQDSETIKDKLLIQLQMIFAFLMSVSLPGVFEGQYAPFLVSFALVRTVQLYMMHMSYVRMPDKAPKTKNVFWGTVIATVLWCIVGFVPFPFIYAAIGAVLMLDVFIPLTRGEGNSKTILNLSHLQERLGLFLILVIGESMLVVALANTVAHVDITRALIVLSGIILMIALWWSYFGYLEQCGEGRRPNNMYLFLHAHSFLFGGVVLLAAAYKNFLKHSELLLSDQLLLTGGVFLVSCMLIVIRSTYSGLNLLRTGAMRAMAIGVPLTGYLGYQSGEVVVAVSLVTLWIVALAFYDEKKRIDFYSLK